MEAGSEHLGSSPEAAVVGAGAAGNGMMWDEVRRGLGGLLLVETAFLL